MGAASESERFRIGDSHHKALRVKVKGFESVTVTIGEMPDAAIGEIPYGDCHLWGGVGVTFDKLYSIGYNINMITVRETENFKKWIRALKDRIAQSVITARIRRISAGNFGDSRPVGDGVSELRIDYGPGFRVYFTQRGQEIIILLCGGDKSTQNRDIETAKRIAQNIEEEA